MMQFEPLVTVFPQGSLTSYGVFFCIIFTVIFRLVMRKCSLGGTVVVNADGINVSDKLSLFIRRDEIKSIEIKGHRRNFRFVIELVTGVKYVYVNTDVLKALDFIEKIGRYQYHIVGMPPKFL